MERARIADAFFGPDAESTDGEKTLARRIQVVSDLAALCKMRQQYRRGKPFNWNKVDETAHDTITHRDNEDTKTIKPSPPSSSASPRLSSDQCPFCFFEDSLPQGALRCITTTRELVGEKRPHEKAGASFGSVMRSIFGMKVKLTSELA